MLLYGTLGVCAVLAVLLVVRYDLYEREPWYMLLIMGIVGFAVMAVMGPAENATLSLFGARQGDPALQSMVAATHEEGARLLVVVLLAALVPSQLNDPMDGLIYGSIVGIGMATEESIHFLRLWRTEGPWLPPTEIVRVAGHLVLGGITAFGVGMARLRMRGWLRVLIGCLLVSITVHFFWDLIAITAARAGGMQWWQTLGGMVLMLGGMLFYGMLVVVASDWSRKVFAPHTPRQLWGWPLSLFRPADVRERLRPPSP